MKLHIISHCGKDWMIGINGKDITSSQTSGGRMGDVPYLAIGNDEIEKAPDIPQKSPCRKCGEMVDVKALVEAGE